MTALDALAAPEAARLGGLERASFRAGDARVSHPVLRPEDLSRVADVLTAASDTLRRRSAASLVRVLGRVGARFSDEGDPVRARALDLLPATSGLSRPMGREVLDGMARDWTAEALDRLLRADLGSPDVLDRFVPLRGRRLMAIGPRLCVQVIAGSVPGVGVTALLRSLLVKAPTLIKPGRGDVALPVLFGEALREEDPELADGLAVVYWAGGAEPLERAAFSMAEVVVAYGSDRSVGALRSRCAPTTRFVGYHHRVSVGAVGRRALARPTAEQTAAEVARAIAMFDQRGCVSPHVIFVEEGGDVGPEEFLQHLGAALGRLESSLPSGELELEEAAAVHQLRGTAEMLAAAGVGEVVHGGPDGHWAAVLDRDGRVPEATVGRLAWVCPVRDADGLVARLEPYGRHLQTLGVAGFDEELEALAVACGRIGVTRIAPFEAVPFPPAWWHHDGCAPLGALVRWVELEGSGAVGADPAR